MKAHAPLFLSSNHSFNIGFTFFPAGRLLKPRGPKEGCRRHSTARNGTEVEIVKQKYPNLIRHSMTACMDPVDNGIS